MRSARWRGSITTTRGYWSDDSHWKLDASLQPSSVNGATRFAQTASLTWADSYEPFDITIKPLNPVEAERAFLQRFDQLYTFWGQNCNAFL